MFPNRLCQRQTDIDAILTANNQTEYRDPNGRFKGRTEGGEGVYNPIENTTISINQTDSHPRAPKDLTTNQRVCMEGSMTLATYEAEDCGISSRGGPWSCGGSMLDSEQYHANQIPCCVLYVSFKKFYNQKLHLGHIRI